MINAAAAADTTSFQGFTYKRPSGIVTAAAFVFVSYTGVIKTVSVAEEVENSGRDLPPDILISMG